MTRSRDTGAKGRPAPVLVLCRQCVEYVFDGTVRCPHCGRDARETGARYRDGGYLVAEAIRRIDRVLERHGRPEPDAAALGEVLDRAEGDQAPRAERRPDAVRPTRT